jgi:hypothetical protein
MNRHRTNTLLFSTIISLLVFSFSTTNVSAIWLVDSLGDITIDDVTGFILGKTDNNGNGNNSESENESPGNSAQAKSKVEIKTQGNNGQTQVKINTREKSNGSVKAVPVKDKLKVTLYDENEEIELEVDPETEGIEIEEDADADTISIRSKNNASYVIKNKVAAQSRFPIMVNLETNELMITTPKGTKTVTVLPDKAVENMLAANVLDQLGGKGGLQWLAYQDEINQATKSGDLDDDDDATDSAQVEDEDELEDEDDATESAELDDSDDATQSSELDGADNEEVVVDEADTVVDLVITEDGTLAYEIEGTKKERFFWIREVELHREVIVSAETGELLAVNQSFGTNVLDFFSF